jgi:hypothetical protein
MKGVFTMAVSAKMYGNALMKILNKEVDWDTDTINVLLCTSAYTPDQDAHDYLSDITGEVANGNGYTTGGATLANKTIGYTAGTNTVKLDADDTTWAASTITARYGVVYASTGVAATSPLLGYIDFGADVSSTNGPFTLTYAAAGIFTANTP